ncbi:MAG: PBP1A family penicillin-binding protein [Anaerolineae bacterium]
MDVRRKVILTRRRRTRRQNHRPGFFAWALRGVATLILLFVLFNASIAMAALGSAFGVYSYYAKDLPDPHAIETEQEDFETTKIYDRTGQVLLYEVFDPRLGDREYLTLDRIPQHCIDATVALEDKTFWENPGFDPRGIARAFWQNLQGGAIQGGSSITQQLIKNIIIDPEERIRRSYARKIKEVILATEITRRYEKPQILEWYLNTNHYGNLAYGIQAAAQVYYQKPASELSLAECAMLVPIPQYPLLNPIDRPEEAKKRQKLALEAMVRDGYITQTEADAAFAEVLDIKPIQERFDILAPHFSIYVRKQLEEMFGPDLVYRGGLKVYTTLDLDFNNEAERIAREHVTQLMEEGHNASNACVVAVRPKTGEILAMVGSIDYWNEDIDGNVNVCVADPGRQPGSSFKPFTYATAFAQKALTPATMVMDVRRSFPDPPNPPYVPENYDRKYHGPVRLRQALARSYNIPAVWTLEQAGVRNVINTAHRMGITTLTGDFYGLALTLGGGEVKPLDMAYAFSVFANMGTMAGQPVPPERQRPGFRTLDPVSILRVEDSAGNILWQYSQPETQQVLDPALAYLMADILSDNDARAAAFGRNSALYFEDRRVATKTGTTNDFRDNWTIGFTPQIAVAVWVGNNDNEPMKDVTGLSGAAPIWHEVMAYYLRDKPAEWYLRPPGLVDVRVDATSGLLPTEHSPSTVVEMFLEGSEPKVKDNVHQVFRINRENGKLATVYTPPELVEERVYEIYPPEAADWVRDNGIPQPPDEYDDAYGLTVASGPVAIMHPTPYQYVSGGVIISGNAMLDNFALYRLEYGPGLNPSTWTQLGGDHNSQVDRGPLEFWDTTNVPEGLYTLQLTAVRNDQSFEQAAVQVTVDNTPPRVTLLNPPDGKVYKMEDDEWVNIQVEAVDNVSMDRVEFYLDGYKLDEATVAPYNTRWTIVMSDTIPVAGTVITQTTTVTSPEGIVSQQVVTLTEVITIADPLDASLPLQYMQVYSGGLTIISDTTTITPALGYTETHTLKIVAYDAAGNKTETEITQFHVIHDPEALEEEQVEAVLLPTHHSPGTRKTREKSMAWLSPTGRWLARRQLVASAKGPPG